VTFDVSRVPELSAEKPVAYEQTIFTREFRGGLYVLRAGADDPQQPHAEDEAYYVVSGRATFDRDGKRTPVGPGSAIVVPAGMPHRFVDITEDITLFVLYARRT